MADYGGQRHPHGRFRTAAASPRSRASLPARRGDADGAGGQASLLAARTAVAFDPSSDTLYVADAANHAVRTVASDGTVATLAGRLGRASLDAVGDQASFNSPRGVTFDPSSDTLYVVDTCNHAVRSVASDGTVATLAGTGSQWLRRTGPATRPVLQRPERRRLRAVLQTPSPWPTTIKPAPSASVAVQYGDGRHARGHARLERASWTAPMERPAFWMPYAVADGVAFTPSSDPDSGTLYVADTRNHAVRTVANSGTAPSPHSQAPARRAS